ncbi:MAG: hypothetical protein AAF941_05990 [Pseudomonadota bacterium]
MIGAIATKPTLDPERVAKNELAQMKFGGFIYWTDSAADKGVAFATAGETWEAVGGKRLILSARQWSVNAGGKIKPAGVVYFMQATSRTKSRKIGEVYQQSRAGFVGDIFDAPIEIAGKRLKSTQVLAEMEVNLLLGIVTTVVPAVWWIDKGLSATEWIVFNRKKFPTWIAAIKLILKARRILKTHCPTLWDKIVDAALLGAWKGTKAFVAMFGEDIAGNIPEAAIADEGKLAKATGGLVGKLGTEAVRGRLSALKVIWIVLKAIATHAALSTPGAIKITYKEKKDAALKLVESLKRAGVALSERDAAKVIDEVITGGPIVLGALEKLERGFNALDLDGDQAEAEK